VLQREPAEVMPATSSFVTKVRVPVEPTFVLRAQDRCAPEVVRLWALTAKKHGAPQEKVDAARAVADEMDAWQRKHGSKVPD
jgi:hypothetical protein